jgi:cobalamin synthase
VALVVCAILAWSFGGATGLGLVVLGIILALVVPHLLSARMGGVTGDVMGASVLIVETLLLLTAGVIA